MLVNDFQHLVTLTVVTQPGWSPPESMTSTGQARYLKAHFAYDPDLPVPAFSKRSRARLSHAEARGWFETVEAPEQRMEICELYEGLKARRNFGQFFAMRPSHFKSISN
ncbi:hypothetical protein [Allochromatium palmeri]|uniref:Uncharacterized protein n=1 Tax=Allochromatium palmeri TaxID=231048 RepID=A0A6N8EK08_9GAMM|nr:hypothetical protein [Allochromatium palmeri]MTW23289.1 hypothetical protein [Allochromatium palmeri]